MIGAIRPWPGSLAVACALALLSSLPASSPARAADAATANRPAPRTAWGTPDFSGVWFNEGQGRWNELPYTPAYKPIYDQRKADEAAGKPFEDPPSKCLPGGMPRTMTAAAYPMEIYMWKDQVTTIRENLGASRRIRLDRGHDTEWPRTFMGDSIGRWEGDTLVVDTVNLRDDTVLNLIEPHSDAMHIVERISRPTYDTIIDEITLEDPKAFLRPIKSTVTMKLQTDWELKEYVCENNRNTYDSSGKSVLAPTAR